MLIAFWAVYRFQLLKKDYVKYLFQIDKENSVLLQKTFLYTF